MKSLLEAGAGLVFAWTAYSLLPDSPCLAAFGFLTAAILIVPRGMYAKMWAQLRRIGFVGPSALQSFP